jgi:uncharacterized protein YuzE
MTPHDTAANNFSPHRLDQESSNGGCPIWSTASCSPAARHNRRVRITYDPAADAACIHLTGQPLAPGRTTLQAPTPPGASGFVALDWKDGRLVGIEILDATTRLHHDLPGQAEIPG